MLTPETQLVTPTAADLHERRLVIAATELLYQLAPLRLSPQAQVVADRLRDVLYRREE